MSDLIAPLARIAARYATGALATYGMFLEEGEVYLIVAALIGMAVEGAYALAKRNGGAT
jgi:hypothetical protein